MNSGLGFMPHGHCYFWDPLILWLQNGSDALIAVAYFAIPGSLLYYVSKKPDLPFKNIFRLFAAFILWCGLTHVFDVLTTWYPYYLAQGLVKLATAAVSLFTAVLLIPLIPKALTLRSPADLEAELERRKAELEMQKDVLASSNAELEQFAYAASHDLKAPLRAIQNLSQWIEEDLGGTAAPSVAEHLSLMRQRIKRMSRLLDDLLEYSRVGRQEPSLAEVDLAQLVKDAVETLPPRPGISVRLEGNPPAFKASLVPLRQALMNLISNALKHHDKEQGSVVVSARDLGAAVELTVADDGPGIEARFHDRIFQIFQTLKPRDEVEGSGVGLALVKKIMERHGGSVRLESEPGKGSRFILSWPKGA